MQTRQNKTIKALRYRQGKGGHSGAGEVGAKERGKGLVPDMKIEMPLPTARKRVVADLSGNYHLTPYGAGIPDMMAKTRRHTPTIPDRN